MEIEDFLPKYPSIHSKDFNEDIFQKQEFFENRLERTEPFPQQPGELTKYQKTIVRYMSSHTPYESLILIHEPGLGKCVHPLTNIFVNDVEVTIEDTWKKYASSIDDNWATSKQEIITHCYDYDTRKIINVPIKKLYRQYVNEYVRKITTKDFSIVTTRAHRVLTDQGWRNDFPFGANGQKLVTIHGQQPITSIQEFLYKGWVYDLEIDYYHNYVANNIITHNTCSAIGAIEKIREENNSFTGAIIFAKGEKLLTNFVRELAYKCTDGKYLPEGIPRLTDGELKRRIKKLYSDFYTLETFQTFAKKLKKTKDENIKKHFSNKIIVIDEVHNIQIQKNPKNKKDSIETYNQFHRFLHLIENSKILFLTGTPIVDSISEIASLLNLINPLDKQLPTDEEFLKEFTEKKDDIYTIKPEKVSTLKKLTKGKISFLREPTTTVTKHFLGVKYKNLEHLIVYPTYMSEFQTKSYDKAVEADNRSKGDDGKQGGFRTHARQASLFVFPDGSYGVEGAKKFLESSEKKGIQKIKKSVKKYVLKSELKNELKDDTINKLQKFSSIYPEIIRRILDTDGNCFIFSSLVHGSGCILFSLLLELFGYTKANGHEITEGKRYALLTTETATSDEIRRINDRFNKIDNMQGKFIKVIIGSKTVSEGFSFRNVIFEAILTPHWNYGQTMQALARGIRMGSHKDLENNGIDTVVNIMQPIAIPTASKNNSIEYIMYKTSEDKDISIKKLLRLLMEIAIDCALNYKRNIVYGEDGSRECDYEACDYKCDGIQSLELTEDVIDYSTYDLYYLDSGYTKIREKIHKLFREDSSITFENIKIQLQEFFSEKEIENALVQLEEKGYNYFLNSPLQNIINEIELKFRKKFYIDISEMKELTFTEFELLDALNKIISENIKISDKYGFKRYLREENNLYFLVNSVISASDYYIGYYSKFVCIADKKNFSEMLEEFYKGSIPNMIQKICSNPEHFHTLIKTVPRNVQEIFIEAGIIASLHSIEENKKFQELILEYYKGFIIYIDDMIFSTFLEKEKIFRCVKNTPESSFSDWKDCNDYETKIHQKEAEEIKIKRENNPYGIEGLKNGEFFCLIDLELEKKAKAKKPNDARNVHSGKNCSSWKLPDLVDIIIRRLKIPPPDGYLKNKNREELNKILKTCQKNKSLTKFSKEEIEEMSDPELRQLIYFSGTTKCGGICNNKDLCRVVKDFLTEKGLVRINTECGSKSKMKQLDMKDSMKDSMETTQETQETTLETQENTQETEKKFKVIIEKKPEKYKKQIIRLMKDCFAVDDYDLGNDKWLLIFTDKFPRKLVGVSIITSDNTIWNLCVHENYRMQGIGQMIVKIAVNNICKEKGGVVKLQVEKDAENLIEMYESFGFTKKREDDTYTYMEIMCE